MPFQRPPSDGNPAPIGVILAIDYGQKRLGLALSDEHGFTSRPFATWTRINRRRDLARLRDLVREQGIRKIIIGLPLHLDGSPSEMSAEAVVFSQRVAKVLGLPVELMDERLSSWEAKQMVAEGFATATSSRGKAAPSARRTRSNPPIDDVAASIILRNYLNRSQSKGFATKGAAE